MPNTNPKGKILERGSFGGFFCFCFRPLKNTHFKSYLPSVLAPKPDFYHVIHDGPVTTVQRSPFFKEIVLCVGGWSFTIWKEGITVSI